MIASMPAPSAISFEPLTLAPANLMRESHMSTASEALWNDEQPSKMKTNHPLGDCKRIPSKLTPYPNSWPALAMTKASAWMTGAETI